MESGTFRASSDYEEYRARGESAPRAAAPASGNLEDLVRSVQMAAAQQANLEPRRLSFSRVQAVVMTALPRLATCTDAAEWEAAYRQVLRLNCRTEPAAVPTREQSGEEVPPFPNTSARIRVRLRMRMCQSKWHCPSEAFKSRA